MVSIFRELVRVASRVGRPGTLVRIGDAEGALLYLEASMAPVSVVAALELEDVRELHRAMGEWIRDRDDSPAPPLYTSSDGRSWEPAPLVAGRIGAGLADASRPAAATTVQLGTVPTG